MIGVGCNLVIGGLDILIIKFFNRMILGKDRDIYFFGEFVGCKFFI